MNGAAVSGRTNFLEQTMNRNMRKRQAGFTLIELVVVIIILGIMAAVALPKFVDISADAHTAAAKGVAGAISSGSTINYASRKANSANGVTMSAANVCTNTILAGLLTTSTTTTLVSAAAANDNEFQVSGTGDCSGANVSVSCNITPKGGAVALTSVICVP